MKTLSPRPAYARFLRFRARLEAAHELERDARGQLICATPEQQLQFDELWHKTVLEALTPR